MPALRPPWAALRGYFVNSPVVGSLARTPRASATARLGDSGLAADGCWVMLTALSRMMIRRMNHRDSPSSPHPQYPRGFRARRGLNSGFLGLCTRHSTCAGITSHRQQGDQRGVRFQPGTDGGHHHHRAFCLRLRTDHQRLAHRPDRRQARHADRGSRHDRDEYPVWRRVVRRDAGLFIAIRGVDGYLQAFGAPGMVKINTAWFRHRSEADSPAFSAS